MLNTLSNTGVICIFLENVIVNALIRHACVIVPSAYSFPYEERFGNFLKTYVMTIAYDTQTTEKGCHNHCIISFLSSKYLCSIHLQKNALGRGRTFLSHRTTS